MSVKQLFDLSGKVALVTGGSRGLGLQMAEGLGEMGAKLAICARQADELAGAAARLQGLDIEVLTFTSDLQDFAGLPALVNRVLWHYGRLDILVNNAGTVWAAPAETHPAEAWHKVMNLNVDTMFFLSQEVARRCLIPQHGGKIINIASVAGLSGGRPEMPMAAYRTSKAAAINLTRALAAEWGQYGINVNAICPGFFPTKMSAGLLGQAEQAVIARTPLKRIGGAEDLKGTVVFLASDASRHISGQYIAVDGGACIV